MQNTGITHKSSVGNDGETTLKVSKQIHHEMITEFPKFGFTTLGQYTDFVLKKRLLLMESVDPSNHTPSPAIASQALSNQLTPQGTFITDEEMTRLREAFVRGDKAQENLGKAERKVEGLSNVLEGLLLEAINFHEGFFQARNREVHFTKVVNDLLRREGLA